MSHAGFKNADLQTMTRWDEMVQIFNIAAGKVETRFRRLVCRSFYVRRWEGEILLIFIILR
jgi:hypothetical protein